MSAETKKRMQAMAEHNKNISWTDIPDTKYPVYDIYGKKFDPTKINEYIDGFTITRTVGSDCDLILLSGAPLIHEL